MNNRTFLDSSSFNRTIGTVGTDIAQCTKSPNSPGSGIEYNSTIHGASVYIRNNTANYLTTTLTSNWLNIGTGDFTMSCWLFPLDPGSQTGMMFFRWGTWGVLRFSSNQIIRFGSDSAGIIDSPANMCPLYAWTHIAISRNSGTLRMFLNGSLVSSVSSSQDLTVNTGDFLIGRENSSWYMNGFISGVHIVVGTGLYTSNFTPEVIPTAVANTRLLLKFDNIGLGDSTCKVPLITVGNTVRSTTQKKYGNASMYFPGTVNDYVYVPSGIVSDFALGTGNFTMEAWVRPEGNANTVRIIAQIGSPFINFYINSSNRFAFSINDASILADSTVTITYGQWYHLALVRFGGTYYFFIDGVLKITSSAQGTLDVTTSQLFLGRFSTSALYPFNGYIDDFRVFRNVAKYTSNFTPPGELSRS